MQPRPGTILILAIFALVALEALAAGMLFVATQERLVASAWADHLRTRLAAESAARVGLAQWDPAFEELLPGGRRIVPGTEGELPGGVSYAASVERLEGDFFLLRGRAWRASAGRRHASAESAILLRGRDPAASAAEVDAAITGYGRLVLDRGVRVSAVPGNDATPPDCPVPTPGLALRVLPDSLQPRSAVVSGEVGIPPAHAAEQALGPLSWRDAARLADVVESGELHLSPSNDSTFPLIYANGDLRVTGAGQGILIVAGDLTIEPGAHFSGVIVVRGQFVARDATLEGAVRIGAAGGDASRIEDGSVTFDACVIARAFAHARALGRPYRTSARLWIPLR
jgi:hypothetical protein